MGALDAAWQRAAAGQAVTIRPRGNSMAGLIPDGATVVVQPCRPETLEVDDIVLVRVAGSVYLHKVTAVDAARSRVQIGNNRGRINGWAGHAKVAGLVTSVNGTPRPRLGGKLRPTDSTKPPAG